MAPAFMGLLSCFLSAPATSVADAGVAGSGLLVGCAGGGGSGGGSVGMRPAARVGRREGVERVDCVNVTLATQLNWEKISMVERGESPQFHMLVGPEGSVRRRG